ncbi:MAG TPA: paraquat-inducible protein A, partial [Candidatus Limnocylindrales bacterium]|nr:paraquat-inducible protein A [Candidatus Limnocylindrales bacterium]
MTTALQAGLVCCHDCGLLSRWRAPLPGDECSCPRCGTTLHQRKPGSLRRTWALLIAGFILYIPANVLPVMKVIYAGRGEPDTILSGVEVLFNTGQPAVALLVLFA